MRSIERIRPNALVRTLAGAVVASALATPASAVGCEADCASLGYGSVEGTCAIPYQLVGGVLGAGNPLDSVEFPADFRGKPFVLVISTSWCTFAGPVYDALHAYPEEQLEILTILGQLPGETDPPPDQAACDAYSIEYGLTHAVMPDPGGVFDDYSGGLAVPESFVYGCDGVLHARFLGSDVAGIEAAVDEVIAETPPEPEYSLEGLEELIESHFDCGNLDDWNTHGLRSVVGCLRAWEHHRAVDNQFDEVEEWWGVNGMQRFLTTKLCDLVGVFSAQVGRDHPATQRLVDYVQGLIDQEGLNLDNHDFDVERFCLPNPGPKQGRGNAGSPRA